VITLAVANAKGGVGKSTTAVHLATGFARQKKRVLLVDLDPQGNTTGWLLGQIPPETKGAADLLLKEGLPSPEEIHPVPDRDRLWLIPATPKLATTDVSLAQAAGGQMVLREALGELAKDYDYAILDCPPNLNVTVLCALCAADAVVAPVLAAFMSLTGLKRLEDTVQRIQRRLNVRTSVLGYVLFAADRRESITNEARELLAQEAGQKLFRSEVRISTAAKTLPAHRMVAWDKGADERGAEDYKALLKEITERLRGIGLTAA
jgi:chromosome partitioning protein